MSVQTHISLVTVDEKIDYYIAEWEHEPYENGPHARRELFDFIVLGIAEGKFDDPIAVCKHVHLRVKKFEES